MIPQEQKLYKKVNFDEKKTSINKDFNANQFSIS